MRNDVHMIKLVRTHFTRALTAARGATSGKLLHQNMVLGISVFALKTAKRAPKPRDAALDASLDHHQGMCLQISDFFKNEDARSGTTIR